jgi:hypothetical protein
MRTFDAAITNYLRDLALSVHNGEAKAADTYAYLVMIRKALDEAIEAVKGDAIDEVLRYGSEGCPAMGMRLTVRSAAGRWSYKHLPPHAYLSERLKAVEELAQTAYRTGGRLATEDGEEVQPAVFIAGAPTIYTTKL